MIKKIQRALRNDKIVDWSLTCNFSEWLGLTGLMYICRDCCWRINECRNWETSKEASFASMSGSAWNRRVKLDMKALIFKVNVIYDFVNCQHPLRTIFTKLSLSRLAEPELYQEESMLSRAYASAKRWVSSTFMISIPSNFMCCFVKISCYATQGWSYTHKFEPFSLDTVK